MNRKLIEYLTTGQAARELQIATGTLQNWRTQGIGPQFIKHRRNVYYHRNEIERYKKENFVSFSSTSEWKDQVQGEDKNNAGNNHKMRAYDEN